MMARILAWLAALPLSDLRTAVALVLAVLYTGIVLTCLVTARPLQADVTDALGWFLLGLTGLDIAHASAVTLLTRRPAAPPSERGD